MAKLYKLRIVTPSNKQFEVEVVSTMTTTANGKIEFLSNHADAICSLIPTVTSFVASDGSKKYVFTSLGVAYFKNNTLTIVCDSMNWPEEIDKFRAEEAMKRASERLKSNEEIDRERANRALARAMARLELNKYM